MPVRTSEEFDREAVKIRGDGSQDSPDVVSMEEAMRIQDDIDRREAARRGKEPDVVVDDEQPGKPPAKTPEKKTPEKKEPAAAEDPLKDVTEEQLEAINQKVEKKEKLTDDEQAILDSLADEAPPEFVLPKEVQDEEITIGGEKKSLSDLFNQFQEERNIDLSGLDYKVARGLLDDYLAGKHDDAWKATNTRKSQEIAARAADLSRQEAILLSQKKQVLQKAEKVKADILKAKELAAQNPDEIDLYDEQGRIDPKKLTQRDKIIRAQERLPELESDLKDLEAASAQTDTERLYMQLEALQQVDPRFHTSKPVRQAIADYEQAASTNSVPDNRDTRVIRAMYKIIDEAIDGKMSVELAAKLLGEDGSFAALKTGATPTESPTSERITSPKKSREELIAEIRRKQAGARPNLGGGSNPRLRSRGVNRRTLADTMREHSDRARGGGEANNTLDTLESL